jgi:hypothetical protein
VTILCSRKLERLSECFSIVKIAENFADNSYYSKTLISGANFRRAVLKTKKMKILLISDARFMTVTYLLQCNPQLLVKNSFL